PLRPHYADGVHERTAPTLPPASVPAPRPTGSGAVDQSVALWSALAGLGMREAVLAPGSRSAPLVYALASAEAGERIRAHVRIDERAAAFTALGISRHDPAHPAAVVTTSGTATAHLHAVVMEAHHARIPLLVLTADRPAELREVGANQTTRQAGMFRSLVRLAVDLPAPTADEATALELRPIVSTAARALPAATGDHPGTEHPILSFRDPLVPRPRTDDPAPLAETPAQRIVLTRRAGTGPAAPHPVPVDDRTVVVAGDGAGPEAAELAARHGLPLLAEPSSGARHGQTLVPGYPALLREVMADAAHPPRPARGPRRRRRGAGARHGAGAAGASGRLARGRRRGDGDAARQLAAARRARRLGGLRPAGRAGPRLLEPGARPRAACRRHLRPGGREPRTGGDRRHHRDGGRPRPGRGGGARQGAAAGRGPHRPARPDRTADRPRGAAPRTGRGGGRRRRRQDLLRA